MGKVLEMIAQMKWGALLAIAFGLGGCGSDHDATTGQRLIQSARTQIMKGRSKGTAAPAITRQALSAFTTPMIMAEIPTTGLTTFLVPYAQNGDVETWATADDKTISFRQGIMVATRGFGPDIMQAVAPTAKQLAAGAGSFERAYYYLDGADQTQRYTYQCTLSSAGPEQITVVDMQHSTRHVLESCAGEIGNFVNEYWFENGIFLRKSKQMLVQAWGAVIFQRVIDKG